MEEEPLNLPLTLALTLPLPPPCPMQVEEMLFNLAVSRQPAPPPLGALPASARPAPFSAPLTAPLPPSVRRGDSQPATAGLLDGCVVVGDSQPPGRARGGAATPPEAEPRAQSAAW